MPNFVGPTLVVVYPAFNVKGYLGMNNVQGGGSKSVSELQSQAPVPLEEFEKLRAALRRAEEQHSESGVQLGIVSTPKTSAAVSSAGAIDGSGNSGGKGGQVAGGAASGVGQFPMGLNRT